MGRMKTHRWWWSPEFLAAIMGGLLAEFDFAGDQTF
jgi:hypothetical protein